MNPAERLFAGLQSGVEGVAWPPITYGMNASLTALAHSLEASQWLSPEALAEGQFRQLVLTAGHAAAHSEQFRSRLAAARLVPADLGSPEGLRRLPPLSRRQVQAAGALLHCRQVPQQHAPVGEVRTSGSSGEPVVVRRTQVNVLFWHVHTLREHIWWERELSGTLAVIRAYVSAAESRPDWGAPLTGLVPSGPCHALPLTTDPAEQWDWLERVDPHYLLSYPTNTAALLDEAERRGRRLSRLRQVRSMAETLTPALRERTLRVLGVPSSDGYSSQEMGVIALECPVSGLYHLMAENLMVEVLDAEGAPCGPGETGRVVVTDLLNLATPLIRYDLGDYAEVGPPCPCGRGLPTLARVLGRERNMVVLPDGRRHWPLVGFARYRDVAPVRQYQLIQTSRRQVEVRLVCERALTGDEESALGRVIVESLGAGFDLSFRYFEDRLPLGPGGKFEEFVCALPPGGAAP